MRALQIAFKDLKIIVRDRKALAVIIAMPLVLMTVLGSALGSMFEQGSAISQFTVAVVDLDHGAVSEQLLSVLESEELSQLLRVTRANSAEEARALIEDGQAAAAVIIPAGTSTVISGENSPQTAAIRVLTDPAAELHGSIIRGIVETFTEQYSVIYAGTSALIEAIMSELAQIVESETGSLPSGMDAGQLGNSIGEQIGQRTIRAHNLLTSSHEDKGWLSAFQYYAAAMTVMFSLFAAMRGVESIMDERDNRTLMRLFSTRATKANVVAGKMLGILLTCLLQMTVLILVTSLAFRVNWGSLPGVIVITLALAVAATGFMVFLGALARRRKTADALQNVGVQLVAFMSGCTFPVFSFPPVLRRIANVNFCWWALKSYMDLMLGGSFAAVVPWALLIVAVGVVFLGLGTWRLRLE